MSTPSASQPDLTGEPTPRPLVLEARTLVRLATPVAIAQLGMMSMGLVDTWMVGKLGADALAAVALGDMWMFSTFIIGMGILLGMDPMVSQAHGRRDGRAAALALHHGLIVAVLISVPLMLIWRLGEPGMIALGQEVGVAQRAQRYLDAQLFAVPLMFMYIALRQYLQGRGHMWPSLLTILVANAANLFLDFALINGEFGFPAMGTEGAGLASGLARTVMFGALILITLSRGLHRGAWVPFSRASFSPRGIWKLVAIGLPVGLQLGAELWAFAGTTTIAGTLGVEALAAHTIALKLTALAFMIPVGISIASATRVGNLIGARDRIGAQRVAWLAFALGAVVMTCSGIVCFAIGSWWPEQFSTEAPVVAMAMTVIPIAILFQVVDGAQSIGGGILRGMGDARPALVFNLVGYYAIGLPIALLLTFNAGLGLPGVWIGLAVGLTVISVMLVAWIKVRGPASSRAPAAVAEWDAQHGTSSAGEDTHGPTIDCDTPTELPAIDSGDEDVEAAEQQAEAASAARTSVRRSTTSRTERARPITAPIA